MNKHDTEVAMNALTIISAVLLTMDTVDPKDAALAASYTTNQLGIDAECKLGDHVMAYLADIIAKADGEVH